MIISLNDEQAAEVIRTLSDASTNQKIENKTLSNYLDLADKEIVRAQEGLDEAHDYLEDQTERFKRYCEWADTEADDHEVEVMSLQKEISTLSADLIDATNDIGGLEYAIANGYADELIPANAYDNQSDAPWYVGDDEKEAHSHANLAMLNN